MKIQFIRLGLLLLLLAAASSAFALIPGYDNPPPFDPQRTLLWDFSASDTWETPFTAVGPTWDTGDWTCDDITYSPNLQWVDASSQWAGHQGMIGLDNTQGTDMQTMWIKFHINNFPPVNPLKKVWYEAEIITWGEAQGSDTVTSAPGYTCSEIDHMDEDLGPGFRIDALWYIEPNPLWEEVTLSCDILAGGGVFVDNFYVSTACVPEPSALLALGSGLLGLAGLVIRKRR